MTPEMRARIETQIIEYAEAEENFRPDWPADAPWMDREQEKDDAIADVYASVTSFLRSLLGGE